MKNKKKIVSTSSLDFHKDIIAFKIVGSSFQFKKAKNLNKHLAKLIQGVELRVVAELSNKNDKNACAVYHGKKHIGYVPRDQAAVLSPKLKAGEQFQFFLFDFELYLQGLQELPVLSVLGIRR